MIEYEIIKHDKMKDLRVFINSIKMRSLHMHHDIELLLVLEGKGTIIIKSKKYYVTKGDTILIGAYETHEIIATQDSLTVLIIQFNTNTLKNYFPKLNNVVFLDVLPRDKFPKKEYTEFVNNIINISASYLKAEELFEFNCISCLSNILYSLFKYMDTIELSQSEYSKRNKVNNRIDRINSYIDANFQSPIRLQDIADIENITATHLSHFITENFGMSFQDYLTDKRLEYSLRMISDTSLTLSEIASVSGFSELKYMNKAFKETFDLTPNEYREKGFISLPINKKANVLEYIYSDKESLTLLKQIENKLLM